MTERKDPYEVLGVARDADQAAIQKAYKKLARKYHPDLNPGDAAAEERFKEISAANRVLGDPEARANYDEFGDIALEQGFDADEARRARESFGARFGGAGMGGQASGDFQFGDIDDLLGQLFGAGSAGGRGGFQMPGRDLEAELELDFLDAVRGGEKRLTLARPNAQGVPTPETITVRIPPGVDDGGRLRLAGKGAAGSGNAPPGDLWVRLRVRPHPVFKRDGRNLSIELPISVREAILGAKVEVPTLDGRVTLTIPPGTDSGKRFRLKGKGVPSAGSGAAGDLFARVQIRVPKGLDDEAAAALERLADFEDPGLRKELGS